MRTGITSACLVHLTICLAAGAASPADVRITGWRTDGTGAYPGARPTMEWAGDRNVIWSTKLPASGNATPAIVGNRIFIGAEPEWLLCLSTDDGEILWKAPNGYLDLLTGDDAAAARAIIKAADAAAAQRNGLDAKLTDLRNALRRKPKDTELRDRIEQTKKRVEALRAEEAKAAPYRRPEAHGTNGYSSPTPVTDGEHVYALFGNGAVACYDLDGSRRWGRVVERPSAGWGQSASPLVVGDVMVVLINGLHGLDRKTGRTVWRAESAQRWGSPVSTTVGGVGVVVTPGGDVVRASDGRVLARDLGSLEYNAPLVHDGVIYFMQENARAYRLPDRIDGDAAKPELLWKASIKNDRYYASPVYHDGLVYAIQKDSILTAVDATTGEPVYEEKLDLGGGTIYPSLVIAADLLFASSDNGTTLVIRPGRQFVAVRKNSLEPFRSCPVFVADRFYVRGLNHMYCIGASARTAALHERGR